MSDMPQPFDQMERAINEAVKILVAARDSLVSVRWFDCNSPIAVCNSQMGAAIEVLEKGLKASKED